MKTNSFLDVPNNFTIGLCTYIVAPSGRHSLQNLNVFLIGFYIRRCEVVF